MHFVSKMYQGIPCRDWMGGWGYPHPVLMGVLPSCQLDKGTPIGHIGNQLGRIGVPPLGRMGYPPHQDWMGVSSIRKDGSTTPIGKDGSTPRQPDEGTPCNCEQSENITLRHPLDAGGNNS